MSFAIAVAGKGGNGKTSICSLIIRYLLKNGKGPVLAVDADANANLGESLGLPVKQTVGGVLLLNQPCGVLLDRLDIADADEGAGEQEEDDQAESGDQDAQQAALGDAAGRG